MSDAITQALIGGLIVGVIVALVGVYMRRRPHGKCAYCQNTLAMMGKYSRVCPKCKRTQPWVDADPQKGG